MLLRHPGDEPRRRPDAAATRSDAWGLAATIDDADCVPVVVCPLPDRRGFSRRRRGGGRGSGRGRPAAVAAEPHRREAGPGNTRRPGDRQPQSIARPESQPVARGAQFPRHHHGLRHLEETRRGLQGHRPFVQQRRAVVARWRGWGQRQNEPCEWWRLSIRPVRDLTR